MNDPTMWASFVAALEPFGWAENVDTLADRELLPKSGIPDVNSLAPRLPSPEYMAAWRAWRAARDAGAR